MQHLLEQFSLGDVKATVEGGYLSFYINGFSFFLPFSVFTIPIMHMVGIFFFKEKIAPYAHVATQFLVPINWAYHALPKVILYAIDLLN